MLSHAHPLPNRVAPAAESLVLKDSKSLNVLSIAAAKSPLGAPPPLALILGQNNV